jgi:hypothetical protein
MLRSSAVTMMSNYGLRVVLTEIGTRMEREGSIHSLGIRMCNHHMSVILESPEIKLCILTDNVALESIATAE